ncbi:MAG: AI-2E family transporter [Solobacterium sp.]|nr:AI-2E family transporter [Solobacterium sp.]
MFRNLFRNLDRKYVKIAAYAGFTCLITFYAGYIIWHNLPVLQTVAVLLGAIMKPLTLGGVITYLLYPLVNSVQKQIEKSFPNKKWTRSASVFLVLILIAVLIIAFLAIVSIKFAKTLNFNSLTTILQNYKTDLKTFLDQVSKYLAAYGIKLPSLDGFGSTASNISGSVSNITSFVSGIASGASTIFFGIIFAIYFLIDGHRISSYWGNVIRKLFPPNTIRICKELLNDADSCFSGYIRGQSIDAVIVGVTVSLVFSFMGMKYALIIGLLAGVGNLIPYFGPSLGYISVILVNLIDGNIPMLIYGLIVLQIIMIIDGNIINPRLLANTISIHPLLVVASLLAGGAIGGLLGLLLAVPVGAFLKLQFDKWLARKEPPEDAPEKQDQ